MREQLTIRRYEAEQLTRFLRELIDRYTGQELDDRVERLEGMRAQIDDELDEDRDDYSPIFGFGTDDISLLVSSLNDRDGTKANWLRAKLARRADMPAVQMGFTSSIPIMSFQTGIDPVHPDEGTDAY